MKNTQKITRVQLKISHDEEVVMVGLVSSEPDYKLSLILNKKFRISLKNISPITISDADGNELIFSRFSDANGTPDVIFNLISNRSGKNFLLKKLKNIDYIFQVPGPDRENNIDLLISTLKEIDSITAVFHINTNTIKDKNLHYLIH
jgi:ribosomal protein S11